MNEFNELKPGFSYEDVLKYNGESVLLLNHNNYRNLIAGTKLQMDILSSLYGIEKLKTGKLSWYLKDNHGQIHSWDEIKLSNVDNGEIVKLGTISLTAPELARPVKLTLFAHLSGGEYEIDNNWDFWVFPKPNLNISVQAGTALLSKFSGSYPSLRPINTADTNSLRIVQELDGQSLTFLNNGGRVLLLGSKPFATLPTTFQASPGYDVKGNMATIITDHPIFSSFPHEGFCDWQFYGLLNDANAIVFEDGRIRFGFQLIFNIIQFNSVCRTKCFACGIFNQLL